MYLRPSTSVRPLLISFPLPFDFSVADSIAMGLLPTSPSPIPPFTHFNSLFFSHFFSRSSLCPGRRSRSALS